MSRLQYLCDVLNEEPLSNFGRKLVLAELVKLHAEEKEAEEEQMEEPPCRCPVSVPWGKDWPIGPHTFRIEDIHVDGIYRRTEAYAIHSDGTHNPIGHFSGSRAHCIAEMRRIASIYHCWPGERCVCRIYPTSTCHDARAFLADTEDMT